MRSLLFSVLALSALGGAAFAAACSSSNDATDTTDGGDEGGATSSSGATYNPDDSINTSGVGAGTGGATGLPCDVQQVLENYCIGCHLATTKFPLLSYDDLQKPAPSDPTKTMALRSLERMSAGEMPPKPAIPLDPDEFAAFKTWIDANMPKNNEACTTTPPAGDAGAGADSGLPSGPTVCTSNTTWKGGDEGDENMHPGGVCITCHTQRGGPNYKVAGTVYPTAHEPNDCNGVKPPVQVIITDSHGKDVPLDVNGVGNFFLRGKVSAPFKARVVSAGKIRAMKGTVTAGDCNSCHTEKGANGAPGRIVAP